MNNPSLLLIMITCTILMTMAMFQVRALEETRSGAVQGVRTQHHPTQGQGLQETKTGCHMTAPDCYKICLKTIKHQNYEDIDQSVIGTNDMITVTIYNKDDVHLQTAYINGGLKEGQGKCSYVQYDLIFKTVEKVEVKTNGVDAWYPKHIKVRFNNKTFCCLAMKRDVCWSDSCGVDQNRSRNVTCRDAVQHCKTKRNVTEE